MKFLVTGGAGFIGSHITEYLLKQGHFVMVLDDFSSGKEENLAFVKELGFSGFELIRGDIRDIDTCLRCCSDIDAVLHQAALRSVPKSMKNPALYNDVNINGILRMLEACVEKKVKRFVFASSSSVYGDVDKFPEKEDFCPGPISPYALTKLAGENYLRVFSENFGLETVALRYFNVFGPKQALDDEYSVVIPKFIHCLKKSETPPVFGNGRQTRDFTYVDNVVHANELAAVTPGIKHEVFNVACGRTTSVLDLLKLLNKLMGTDIKPDIRPARAGDIFKTQADISRIKRTLHYVPYVYLEEGLKRTIESSKL